MKNTNDVCDENYIGGRPLHKRIKHDPDDLITYIDKIVDCYDSLHNRFKTYRDACARFVEIYKWCIKQRNVTNEELKDFIYDVIMIFQQLCDNVGPYSEQEYDWVERFRNSIFIGLDDFRIIDSKRIKQILKYRDYDEFNEYTSSLILAQVDQIYERLINQL